MKDNLTDYEKFGFKRSDFIKILGDGFFTKTETQREIIAPPHEITNNDKPPADITITQPLALPNYEHKSEGLKFVEEAIKQFWSTYDAEDPNTAPKKDEVVDYLKQRGASGNLAQAVDLILRPSSLRSTGRRKNQ